VPGVAVTALLRCLLVKASVFGKTSRDEPVLPVLFARELQRVDPELAECLAVTYWPGGEGAAEAAAFDEADLVVVYGGAEAVAAARARSRSDARLVAHGPRISVALVGADVLARDASADAAAADAAIAVATFDQRGCVSPRTLLVETDDFNVTVDFARRVAEELRRLGTALPRGRLQPAEAAAVLEFSASAEFREIAGASLRVFGGASDGVTVVADDAALIHTGCASRTVPVGGVADLENDAPARLADLSGILQTVGVATSTDRLPAIAAAFARLGVSRITSIRDMPWPPADWRHDGAGPLQELLRWTDLET
jgi:hypothetical protein